MEDKTERHQKNVEHLLVEIRQLNERLVALMENLIDVTKEIKDEVLSQAK